MHICIDSIEGRKIKTADVTGYHTITVKALQYHLQFFLID